MSTLTQYKRFVDEAIEWGEGGGTSQAFKRQYLDQRDVPNVPAGDPRMRSVRDLVGDIQTDANDALPPRDAFDLKAYITARLGPATSAYSPTPSRARAVAARATRSSGRRRPTDESPRPSSRMTPADRDAAERAKMPRRNPGNGGSWQSWAKEQASWDEGHIQPTVEYIKEGLDPEATLEQVEEDLDGYQQQWRSDHADSLAEYGMRTNAAINEVFEVYKEEYLYLAERRMDHIAPKGNPGAKAKPIRIFMDGKTYAVHRESPTSGIIARGPRKGERITLLDTSGYAPGYTPKRNPGTSEDRDAGIETYKGFHRYDPIDIGDFDDDFKIPKKMLLGGKGTFVTYRSAKVDPSTLKKPRNPVNYVHEFDAGVNIYVDTDSDLEAAGLDEVDVPAEFRSVQTLVMLGHNLGYEFMLDGQKMEAEATEPLPELYCTPDGKCLLVIQDKCDVLAMIWGGALGVFPRGIDG